MSPVTRAFFTRTKVNGVWLRLDCPWGCGWGVGWVTGREHWKDSICPRLTWPLGGATDRTGEGGVAGEGLAAAPVDTIKNRILINN